MFKRLIGLALTLCVTMAVILPVASAATKNTGSYNWSISSVSVAHKREWNGKSADQMWYLTGGSNRWGVHISDSESRTIRSDLRKVIPLGVDTTLLSDNFTGNNSTQRPTQTFRPDSGGNSYYTVVSTQDKVGVNGTTTVS